MMSAVVLAILVARTTAVARVLELIRQGSGGRSGSRVSAEASAICW